MKILMLGGTRFFGKQAVKALIDAGYDVTIATRGMSDDTFGEKVKRIILNREDKNSLAKALKDKYFDVVYDNICYAPDDVKNLLDIVGVHIGKYIVTSSLAVYNKGHYLNEASFDSHKYPIQYGDRKQYSYSEGKRLVEAVAYQEYSVPTIAVRFPIVIGENDYIGCLKYYVEHIVKQIPFMAKGIAEPMSFITEEEAGKFLALLATCDFVGPINASSKGDISVGEILRLIEVQAGKKAVLTRDGENVGPYSSFGNVTLDSRNAENVGMQFVDTEQAFRELIAYEIHKLKEDE